MRAPPVTAVAMIGALLLGNTAVAQAPPTMSIVATDNVFNVAGGGPAAVTIASGDSVMFSYPAGASAHDVVFTGATPANCVALSRLRRSLAAGRASFAVPLSATARRALRRNGRLAITLRLTVSPPSGTAHMATRSVILQPL